MEKQTKMRRNIILLVIYEATIGQKRPDLILNLSSGHEEGVRAWKNPKVIHSFDLGPFHRHFSVILTGNEQG